MQIKQKRLKRTGIAISFYMQSGAILLFIGYFLEKNIKILIMGAILLFLNIVCIGLIFFRWSKHHELQSGMKYAFLHNKIENSLIQALYDDGYYVERAVLFKKCAVIPRIEIYISPQFDKGVIKIENSIKLDKRLEELPISSALPDEYILSRSYIDDDCNNYIYEFELYHVEQLSFQSSKEFFDYSRNTTNDYELFLDSRHKVPLFHALIVGQTGSGKSYCLYNFVLQLGCFCIIAQQQSNASNLSTELKENLPFKLILGMAERQTYITALGVYPDVAKRKFECGQGLLVYPQIATPEMPAVTSIAKLDFDILKAIDCIEEYKNEEKEGQAGVM